MQRCVSLLSGSWQLSLLTLRALCGLCPSTCELVVSDEHHSQWQDFKWLVSVSCWCEASFQFASVWLCTQYFNCEIPEVMYRLHLKVWYETFSQAWSETLGCCLQDHPNKVSYKKRTTYKIITFTHYQKHKVSNNTFLSPNPAALNAFYSSTCLMSQRE